MTVHLREQIKFMINTVLGNEANINELSDTQSLVSSGLLSSLQIVEIASLIEKDYGVDFSVIGFNVYYFESVVSIEKMIANHASTPKNFA